MNQLFSFNRFKLLALMHWANNKKRYGLAVLGFMGLLIGRFLLSNFMGGSDDRDNNAQKSTYFFFLFVIGTFYASQYFQDLGSKAKASNFILIPASTFEKLLCNLLYTVVLFIGVFTAVYYLVDFSVLKTTNEFFRTSESVKQDDPIINVFKTDLSLFREDLRINSLLLFLSIQSAFVFGSAYFKKYNFIKTIISGFVVYGICFGVVYMSCKPVFPGDRNQVSIPREIEQIFGILVMYVVAPFFWILTYYRLKQKQV